jgi:hypothetical protein
MRHRYEDEVLYGSEEDVPNVMVLAWLELT